MTLIAAVVVTHNAGTWLDDALTSILAQTRAPDAIVVVDDGSTDETRDILGAHGIEPIAATTRSSDTVTRIAANFVQGVRACSACDLVVLGDHDDIWLPDRVEHQAELLSSHPEALMVASDGVLVDSSAQPTGGTIRSTFPVAPDWDMLAPDARMRFALRHSIATGGASMMRPSAFPSIEVPDGWLHDRWWSLVATARDGMLVDARTVIDYRVAAGQQVGLDTASQGAGPLGRLTSLVAQARRSWGKQRDLRRLLRPMATDDAVASVIRLRGVL